MEVGWLHEAYVVPSHKALLLLPLAVRQRQRVQGHALPVRRRVGAMVQAAEEHDSREQQATATPLQPPTPQPLQPPGPSASSSTVSGGVNGAAAPAGAAALDARDL